MAQSKKRKGAKPYKPPMDRSGLRQDEDGDWMVFDSVKLPSGGRGFRARYLSNEEVNSKEFQDEP